MRRGTHHSENDRHQHFVYEDVFELVLPGLGRDTATEGVCAASHTLKEVVCVSTSPATFKHPMSETKSTRELTQRGKRNETYPFLVISPSCITRS